MKPRAFGLPSLFLGLFVVLGTFAAPVMAWCAPEFARAPVIRQNDNPTAPLAAILTLNATDVAKAVVSVSDGKKQWDIIFDATRWDLNKALPLVGMRANTKHDFSITVMNAQGKQATYAEKLTYTTPPLPENMYNFPPITVKTATPEKMEPGLTILSVRHSVPAVQGVDLPYQSRFGRFFGMLVVVDQQGEVVWYYKDDFRIAGVDQLSNGNFIFNFVDFRSIEIDMLGNKLNEWYAADRPQGKPDNPNAIAVQGMVTIHHQPHELPNGNLLSMSAKPRNVPQWYTSETDPQAPRADQQVMGDIIVEFTRAGEKVWEWDAFDHFDPFHIGYQTFDPYWQRRNFPDTWDWTHGNGSTYIPADDSVVTSLRNLDALIKIDRKSGAVVWILSDPINWKGTPYETRLLKPVGDVRWPYHGHNPRLTSAGTIVMYDNGLFQARPFDGREKLSIQETTSCGIEYEIDDTAMTVRMVTNSLPADPKDRIYSSWAMGDAHILPNTRNLLVIDSIVQPIADDVKITTDSFATSGVLADSFPQYSRIREMDYQTKEIYWDVEIKDPVGALTWTVYGGSRFNGFYPTEK